VSRGDSRAGLEPLSRSGERAGSAKTRSEARESTWR
jgi:hypothetical protein